MPFPPQGDELETLPDPAVHVVGRCHVDARGDAHRPVLRVDRDPVEPEVPHGVLEKFFSGIHHTLRRAQWKLLRRKLVPDAAGLARLDEEHAAVLEAITRKNVRRARALMGRHIEDLQQALFQDLPDTPRLTPPPGGVYSHPR